MKRKNEEKEEKYYYIETKSQIKLKWAQNRLGRTYRKPKNLPSSMGFTRYLRVESEIIWSKAGTPFLYVKKEKRKKRDWSVMSLYSSESLWVNQTSNKPAVRHWKNMQVKALQSLLILKTEHSNNILWRRTILSALIAKKFNQVHQSPHQRYTSKVLEVSVE